MTDVVSEPRTETGRALFAEVDGAGYIVGRIHPDAILAIEREAIEQAIAAVLRVKLHDERDALPVLDALRGLLR